MSNLLIYVGFSGLYLSVLYAAFQFASYRKFNFSYQRILLIGSLLFALILPLISFGTLVQDTLYGIQLPVLELGASEASQEANSTGSGNAFYWLGLLKIGFLLGMGLSFFRFLYGLFKILFLVLRSTIIKQEQLRIIKTRAVKTPASFWHFIFLPQELDLDSDEAKIILMHERFHFERAHSLDNLLVAACQVFYWWLPTYYFLHQKLRLIHEYEVDALMLHSNSKYDYSNFLIEQLSSHQELLLVNNFNSFTQKRIVMMYQEKKPVSRLLGLAIYLLAIPAIVFIQSCQQEKDQSILAERNLIELDRESEERFFEETTSDTIMLANGGSNVEQVINNKRTVYTKPDQLPYASSCQSLTTEERESCSNNALMTFVYTNIKYPKTARDRGTQGMVVSEFVVTDKGNVESVKVIKDIGDGTAEAVMHVLDKMKGNDFKWNPGTVDGKPVNVLYTLPVKFKLE